MTTTTTTATALNQTDQLAEAQVLGTLMLDPDVSQDVVDSLEPSHFSKITHQQIFSVVKRIRAEGLQPDYHVIAERLCNNHGWKSEGVINTLASFADHVAATTMAGHYAGIMRNQAECRGALYICKDLMVALGTRDRVAAQSLADKLIAHLNQGADPAITLTNAALEYADTVKRIEDMDNRRFKCGLPIFDDRLNDGLRSGMLPGQVGLLCARTGYGKSTLASYIAFQMVDTDPQTRVHMFSLEMPAQMIAAKAIKRQIAKDTIAGNAPKGTDSDKAKAAAFTLAGTYGDRVTISEEHEPAKVLARASQQARQGVNVFVFDHLHRIGIADKKQARWVIGEFTRDLTNHAKRHNAAWLVACQLSRAYVKDKTSGRQRWPALDDIAESAQVETHAHWAVALHFDDPKDRTLGRLCVLKNRFGTTNTSALVDIDYDKQSFARRYSHG